MFNSDSQTPFSTRVAVVDDAVVIEVVGEVDLATAPELREALELNGHPTRRVIVNLTEVTFIDSSGLRTLVTAQRKLARQEIELCVVVPHSSVTFRVFEIGGLVDVLHLVATMEEASPA